MAYSRRKSYRSKRTSYSRNRSYRGVSRRKPVRRRTVRSRPQTIRIVLEQPSTSTVQRPDLGVVEQTPRKAKF